MISKKIEVIWKNLDINIVKVWKYRCTLEVFIGSSEREIEVHLSAFQIMIRVQKLASFDRYVSIKIIIIWKFEFEDYKSLKDHDVILLKYLILRKLETINVNFLCYV